MLFAGRVCEAWRYPVEERYDQRGVDEIRQVGSILRAGHNQNRKYVWILLKPNPPIPPSSRLPAPAEPASQA